MAPKRTSKPTPTPDVLKAVADLVEPTRELTVTIEEVPLPEPTSAQKEFVDKLNAQIRNEALSELAQANAFFSRNGNLRVHGNFTINELYEAFKARLDYETDG